ncbi:MAG: nucleotide exchange factor GrpE [Eubacteriales bacterium]|nr:nucleotide exchange factor GrpE [Eubacteriales bacterium]
MSKKKPKDKPEVEQEQTAEAEESREQNLANETREAELAELQEANAELQDRFLRLQAEYENYRKRSTQELALRYEDAVVDVSSAWLEVLDNLDRAIEASEQVKTPEGKKLAEGVELVRRQALDTMQKLGIEEIEGQGSQFDPKWHEALHHLEDPELGENEVVQVFKKGYKKGERVLRHAQVQVAN